MKDKLDRAWQVAKRYHAAFNDTIKLWLLVKDKRLLGKNLGKAGLGGNEWKTEKRQPTFSGMDINPY